MRRAVFLGPTIPPALARRHTDAVLLPPLRQGDLYRLARRVDVEVIGIVDGYFRDVPSVWHKEILWALSRGIAVIGAASMGALRAAELAEFGMSGVGVVFEALRRGRLDPYPEPFEDDDEVAVVHGPAGVGYAAASEALVNLRVTLAHAADAGVICGGARDALVRMMKATPFPKRSWPAVIAAAETLGDGIATALEVWLRDGRVDQKRRDAEALLARIESGDYDAPSVSWRFARTTLWERMIAGELDEPGERLI